MAHAVPDRASSSVPRRCGCSCIIGHILLSHSFTAVFIEVPVTCCQDIVQIEGLDACPALEELWVAEAALARIGGLDGCPRLRRLFLHSNRITSIEGLDALTALEVHDLSDTFHI